MAQPNSQGHPIVIKATKTQGLFGDFYDRNFCFVCQQQQKNIRILGILYVVTFRSFFHLLYPLGLTRTLFWFRYMNVNADRFHLELR